MNNYAVYVGVDVSKHSFTTTLIFDEIRKTFNVPSKPEQFENRLRPLLEELGVDKSNVLIIMESTSNYHLPLAEYLAERQYNVGLANPFSMKRFMDAKMSRAKTDKVDSFFIAEYGMKFFKGPLFKPKTEAQKEIEARVKTLERFNKQLTMLKNQREALSLIPMKGLKKILAHYDRIIESIEKEIEVLEKEIRELCKKHFPEEYRLLKSIPGIGDRAIAIVVSILRKFEGFKRAKDVGSFVGLCPSPVESGSSVRGKGSIKKRGNPYVRQVFYMCALSAVRSNPYCKDLYERLLERGKSKTEALVAVAHKLLRQCYGVLKSRTPFRVKEKEVTP
jgi:transposase